MASGKWDYNVPATGPTTNLSPPPPSPDSFGSSAYYSLVMAAIGGGVVLSLLLIGFLMRRLIHSRLLLNLERRGPGARRRADAEGRMLYPVTGERGGEVRSDAGEETTLKVKKVTRWPAPCFSV